MKSTHHNLQAWKISRSLVKEIYRITKDFPRSERFGLITQLRRAAISVPSNIAEGAARNSNREFYHFLGIARGSLAEVETQLILASDLGYYRANRGLTGKISELFGIIGGLMKELRS